MDFYGFYTGKEFEAYRFLGAHPQESGYVFRTFAPAARAISVIGEFNGWQEIPMHKIYDGNFWECEIGNAREGQMYKYKIYGQDGSCIDHCDPYGFRSELRPGNASILAKLDQYAFTDEKWLQQRADLSDTRALPINIYEIHAGSWKRKHTQEECLSGQDTKTEAVEAEKRSVCAKAGTTKQQKQAKKKSQSTQKSLAEIEKTAYEQDAEAARREPTKDYGQWYSYTELAEKLIPYLKKNGYNYVEVMPLSEHPCDESWGYQNTGFFAPTSRYGTPDELRKMVDMCHEAGIGVIMDFVPVHFAVDDFALRRYDGTQLYEYPNAAVGESEWGSCNFMHSRGEVCSFLQSSAWYWLKEFHFDGLRMDAVSNLIYWQGDASRGENLSAIHFMQNMNSGLKARMPHAILIAEDSSNRPGVTAPVWENGLGFDYKWDLGWMNDTLDYFKKTPQERRANYHKLTFSMMYYYNEKYLLPLSHDEVVHGKATILQKMYGDYEGKFPQSRALYMYMMAHPGKKLNFMGNEIGQLREWDEKREQDWDILKYPLHDGFYHFIRALNKIYLENPAFWQKDYIQDGFTWLDCHQEERCIYAFERKSDTQRVVAVFNFSDKEQADFELTVPGAEKYTVLLNSDEPKYGGQGAKLGRKKLCGEKMKLTLLPYSALYLKVE